MEQSNLYQSLSEKSSDNGNTIFMNFISQSIDNVRKEYLEKLNTEEIKTDEQHS